MFGSFTDIFYFETSHREEKYTLVHGILAHQEKILKTLNGLQKNFLKVGEKNIAIRKK